MSSAGQKLKTPEAATVRDRPGWIPAHITHDWDPDPYAYQTEEELMPAGGPHAQLLAYVMELLRAPLARKGLMMLPDVFIVYLDRKGVQRRVGPDLTLMPSRSPAPGAYSLQVEPLPLAVMEITSQKSHLRDLKDKTALYTDYLGISPYLVIDAIDRRGLPRDRVELHLWRLVGGVPRELKLDPAKGAELPEMGMRVQARGKGLAFVDLDTGGTLMDMDDWQAEAQAQARRAATAETQAKAQTRRAEEEARRAEGEARRAEGEARRAAAAEAEVARLREMLARQGKP